MKVTLYMAISVDWYIATKNWDSEWIYEPDFQIFNSICESSDGIIVGNTTFKQYKWELYPIPKKQNFVLSREDQKNERNIKYFTSPFQIIENCKEQGLENILLVWWGNINWSFLSSWFIDELIIDVQPVILWTGIKLFENIQDLKELEFIEHKSLEAWLNILKYKVKK